MRVCAKCTAPREPLKRADEIGLTDQLSSLIEHSDETLANQINYILQQIDKEPAVEEEGASDDEGAWTDGSSGARTPRRARYARVAARATEAADASGSLLNLDRESKPAAQAFRQHRSVAVRTSLFTSDANGNKRVAQSASANSLAALSCSASNRNTLAKAVAAAFRFVVPAPGRAKARQACTTVAM